jgi:hypothetical protein
VEINAIKNNFLKIRPRGLGEALKSQLWCCLSGFREIVQSLLRMSAWTCKDFVLRAVFVLSTLKENKIKENSTELCSKLSKSPPYLIIKLLYTAVVNWP